MSLYRVQCLVVLGAIDRSAILAKMSHFSVLQYAKINQSWLNLAKCQQSRREFKK
ncbi:hypothetical protein LDG_7414 [Legionella drancourtii LLAP12]|uniref:Uncharacterized protein n=1 Tax=Legionella drancourtii LLAP12 TaxID=658187 RepID=G9EQ68_9GAMM|nr:hypothetical protein LDG_7414 [Legionella drancourtii LLAP12]